VIEPGIRFRLEDMLSYAREAVALLGDRDTETVLRDRMRELALTRVVEIVGEAASKIPAESRAEFQLPWAEAVGLRNKIIHAYGTFRLDIVVKTVRDDFPTLITELDRILTKDRHER
jgi:uncharacterized protein with HEPN domain